MNKKDKQIILEALNRLDLGLSKYTCNALDESTEIYDSTLSKKYSKFIWNKDSFGLAHEFEIASLTEEEMRNHRMIALALFMVAEKDVL